MDPPRLDGCALCRRSTEPVAKVLGICGSCVLERFSKVQQETEAVHARSRARFNLPPAPPRGAFHFVRGQGYDRNRGFGHLVHRAALNRLANDLLGAAIGLPLGLFFDISDQLGRFVAVLVLHISQEQLLGFLGRDSAQPFQLCPPLGGTLPSSGVGAPAAMSFR